MGADRGKQILTVAATDPLQLGRFLQARLGLSAAAALQLIAEGAVRVDLRRAGPAAPGLAPGARVTVFTPASASQTETTPGLRILLADADLLVVEKPAGLSAQPGRRGGPSVTALLPPPASLLHRLDAEASGLLLAARTPFAAAALQAALGRGAIVREYIAVVSSTPPESGRITLRIGPRAQSGPMSALRQCYPSDSVHGQPATTLFRVIGRSGQGAAAQALVLARLGSGRTHQIRVHLAALGCPLCGDTSYGGPPAARLLLHAARLRFPHPRSGALCQVSSPLPPEFAWPASPDLAQLTSPEALATAFNMLDTLDTIDGPAGPAAGAAPR